jgi:hypothetical protein
MKATDGFTPPESPFLALVGCHREPPKKSTKILSDTKKAFGMDENA